MMINIVLNLQNILINFIYMKKQRIILNNKILKINNQKLKWKMKLKK